MTVGQSEFQHIVKPWQPSPQRTYIFTSANLIDPVTGTVAENTTIELSDGFVSLVDMSGVGTSDNVDPDAVKVDMKGKYICPGLIDSHVHIAAVPGSLSLREMKEISNDQSILRQPSVCKSMLARGFTTVRDCGGASLALKESIQESIICGPRLFIAGHALSQTGGHGDRRQQHDPNECCAGHVNGIGRIVDGVDQCLKYAREELRQGSDFIKIMGGGGVASPTDQIQHLQFSDEEIRAIVTVANNAGTRNDEAEQRLSYPYFGNIRDDGRSTVQRVPPPVSAEKNREVLDKGLHALEIANKVGVDICFGTDLLGPLHYAQSKEFAIRSTIQTPSEILRSATTTPARMLRQDKFLGKIAPGFAADLLVLNANPLDDITVLDRPDQHLLATIKEGRVLSSRWSLLDVEASHLPKIG
ncbi:hypothetical protein N7507_002757 [Penicillium longicatenatum]|nr:hypothetical protein N7507_002757 [Penicillium longicatenatum]